MHATQPIGSAPPWKERHLSYGAKLGITLVCGLLLVAAIIAAIVLSVTLSDASGGLGIWLPAVVSGGILGASLIGLVVLFPYATAARRFVPRGALVPATALAQPFEIKFTRLSTARTMRGDGTLRFDEVGLVFEGYREPHALFQIGVVLVVTLVPLILFGFGLGIIPALLIAYFLGRRRITQTVPYTALRELQLEGCRLSFRCDGLRPRKVKLRVAERDGERLYREIGPRFPGAVRWGNRA